MLGRALSREAAVLGFNDSFRLVAFVAFAAALFLAVAIAGRKSSSVFHHRRECSMSEEKASAEPAAPAPASATAPAPVPASDPPSGYWRPKPRHPAVIIIAVVLATIALLAVLAAWHLPPFRAAWKRPTMPMSTAA